MCLKADMRLSSEQIHIIKRAVAVSLGNDAEVRLFGSRLNDDAKGGDVDLHISLTRPIASPVWAAAQLASRLERELDGRRVDVRLWGCNEPMLPIDQVALREGVAF
jgi:predicted nucleotidyltransferase